MNAFSNEKCVIAGFGCLLLVAVGCRTTPAQPPSGTPQSFSSIGRPAVDVSPTASAEPYSVRPAAFVQAAPRQLEPAEKPAKQEGSSGTATNADVKSIPLAEPAAALTLDDLQNLAFSNNPVLAEATARVDAARGECLQVGLRPNPVIGYSGQQLFSHGEAEQQGLYIEQEFIRGGKLGLNRAVASREVQKRIQHWHTQQQRVLTDVRLGFYDVLVAQRRIATTQKLVRIAEDALRTARKLLEAKESSPVDALRAELELQKTQLAWKNSQNRHVAAWGRLAAVVGLPQAEPVTLTGDLSPREQVLSQDDVRLQLMSASPELAAARVEVDRARWAVQRACVQSVPDVNVQAVAQQDNGLDSSNMNLLVTMPLPWRDWNQGGIRKAQAELIAAHQSLVKIERRLQSRLASVYQRYASSRQTVDEYARQGGILANSTKTLELIRQGYQAGEIGYLDLVTAQRANAETNLAYVESLGQLLASRVELDGLLLVGSLENEPQ